MKITRWKSMGALCVPIVLVSLQVGAAELKAGKVASDLSAWPVDERVWKGAVEETVSLMAQPVVVPRPKVVTTPIMKVKAVHDGKFVAFQLRWKDEDQSDAGPLGKYSDGVAVQFPVKDGAPPSVFMGQKDGPVHILHWRSQYQQDVEVGPVDMKRFYPNMMPDMYPMEFNDHGTLAPLTDEHREVFSHGRAAGNAQSFRKSSAVDEILAEGFGTSAVFDRSRAFGSGKWANGEWTVVIVRPLKRETASTLEPGKTSMVAFAVWQGGKDEVASRKSVTLSWMPLQIATVAQ